MMTLCVIEVWQGIQTSSRQLGETDLPIPIRVDDLKNRGDNMIRLALVLFVVLRRALAHDDEGEHMLYTPSTSSCCICGVRRIRPRSPPCPRSHP
jgi:hypothetical protein